MTNLMPYLNFPGTTREAMTFYHSVIGGDLGMSTFGEFGAAPAGSPAADQIMHAQIVSGNMRLMASDIVPGFGPEVTVGNNYAVSVVGPEDEQLSEWFAKLSEGGTVEMELAVQVWGDKYGAFTDRFGTPWMFNIETGDSPNAQAQA